MSMLMKFSGGIISTNLMKTEINEAIWQVVESLSDLIKF